MATTRSFDDETIAIVLDNGSGTIKAGFAGEDAPRSIFPNIIGRPRKHDCVSSQPDRADCYIGNKALTSKNILTITYPIEHGIIVNWDDMEKIWDYLFNEELRISPKEHPILITEPSFNPIGNQAKSIEVLFEHFEFPATYIGNQARLAVYAVARCTAMVLEMGDGVIHTMPIYEGYTVPHSIQRLDFGGRNLTDWMVRLLAERGYSFSSTAEREIVRDIKEKHSYVALDFEQELVTAKHSKYVEQNYQLPDGQEIKIGSERFQCTEPLFNPSLVGLQAPNVAQLIHGTLMKVDTDMRRDFQYNIFLSGGTSLVPGLVERLRNELLQLSSPGRSIRVYAWPERKYSVWIGGSIIASLSTFQSMWISRKEYDEAGPSIVYRKCIR